MAFLVGSLALKKLKKHYTGEPSMVIKDVDWVLEEGEEPFGNFDFIRISDDSWFGRVLKDYKETTGKDWYIKIGEDNVATPFVLLLTYLGRIRGARDGALHPYTNRKCVYDYYKIRDLLKWMDDTDIRYLQNMVSTGVYINDWLILSHNPDLCRINYINTSNMVICDQFAAMFYYEQYLHKHYHYTSLDIVVGGDFGQQNVLGSKICGNGENTPFNEFELHKTFKIEKISSLLEKDFPEDVKNDLKSIQEDFNIE